LKSLSDEGENGKKIVVKKDGPYIVYGHVPLVRKTQVVTEHGEPIAWKKEETLETGEPYFLCRCGQSKDKPFCDGTHCAVWFDGTETADTRPAAKRQEPYEGGTHIAVKMDQTLCMDSGFCGTRRANVKQMALETDITEVRSLVMAMIERCPSGALTYSVEPGEADIEPDLPEQIAVTTDITSAGPIEGALWVTGGIPVERADGQPFETRNRVTLCCCGLSKTMPLCDGAHRPKDDEESCE